MPDDQENKVVFHPNAASRFNDLALEILNCVSYFRPPQPEFTEIHPVIQIDEPDHWRNKCPAIFR
jgi:hypothetical protein